MWILKLALIIVSTGVMGFLAILTVLISPSGNLVLSVGRAWGRWISLVGGIRYRVIDAERIDWNRNYLFMTNHASQFDVPALLAAIPISIRFVAKKILFWIPIFGWALYLGGFIGIDRSNRERAIRSLNRAAETIRSGASVVIFAEGTRSRDGLLLPFKKGGFAMAVKAGIPIVPMAISGSRQVLPKGSLKIRPGTIEIRFGDPIPTGEYTMENKEILMERVRNAIREMLPNRSHSGDRTS